MKKLKSSLDSGAVDHTEFTCDPHAVAGETYADFYGEKFIWCVLYVLTEICIEGFCMTSFPLNNGKLFCLYFDFDKQRKGCLFILFKKYINCPLEKKNILAII